MLRALKTILILIDGLGADYFAANRNRLPFLDRLASRGIFAHRMGAVLPGTSMPGRASMLTGVDTSVHGVYGNEILEGARFRRSTAEDLEVPTIARLASRQGRNVVGLGFGMLPPGDTSAHIEPWWEHSAIRGETNLKLADLDEILARLVKDRDGRLAAALGETRLSLSPKKTEAGMLHPQIIGMAADHRMISLAADLASSDQPPDLILTEISVTDLIQHYHGYDSGAALWAYAAADMMVGMLVHRLAEAGVLDRYALVIASDHGHAPIATAIYPERIIPDASFATEGASLHVVVNGERQRRELEQAFAPFGVIATGGDHLPPRVRDRLVLFCAPPEAGFERADPTAPAEARPTGSPIVISTHGFAPGSSGDHRICIVVGPGITPRSVPEPADALAIAPTVLGLLGLPPPERMSGRSLL
jgi:predicted AlkP superfamily pyrophosphatase or phosphodiesterase